MSIISQETWDNMSDEEKEKICKKYNWYLENEVTEAIIEFEDLFGEENLRTKPKIKTWDDFLKEFHKESDWNPKNELADLSLYGMNDKLKAKIIATAKIAKLIELSYGGMVTEEEWQTITNQSDTVPCIVWSTFYNSLHIRNEDLYKHFVAFHTREQAEEFMSYPENIELLHQYYMI